MTLAIVGNLGPLEIGGILLLFVLLFGARKLPELGSSVGKSIRNFKKGMNEAKEEDVAANAASPEDAREDAKVPPTTPPAV